jgi:hypothetical protein
MDKEMNYVFKLEMMFFLVVLIVPFILLGFAGRLTLEYIIGFSVAWMIGFGIILCFYVIGATKKYTNDEERIWHIRLLFGDSFIVALISWTICLVLIFHVFDYNTLLGLMFTFSVISIGYFPWSFSKHRMKFDKK